MSTITEKIVAAATGRMTDGEWKSLCGATPRWTPQQETAALSKGDRARKSEAELLLEVERIESERAAHDVAATQYEKDIKQKDAVIKALADALEIARRRHRSLPDGRSPMHPYDLVVIEDALRLVGRLP